MTTDIAMVIAAYLLGSVASAIVVCRVFGAPDPRTVGSGNPGTTNVLRVAGKLAALLTLLGDAAKGVLPVLSAHTLGMTPLLAALCGLAAFLGHLYPVFYRFQGGKGVATFIGVTLAFDWRLGVLFIVTWLTVALVTRFSSLAALVATACVPAVTWTLGYATAISAVFVVFVGLIFWRHRQNISNLLQGTEGRIGQSSSTPS
ncbi:MAG: glycerol-3-phosphate 1-O-acyltransferase PlsY [Gammaproteobacteria bacterium]|jgi:glycerol-3-phosphate acyltransferase PlsY